MTLFYTLFGMQMSCIDLEKGGNVMSKILKELEKLTVYNEGKRIKIRSVMNRSGSISLLLDYSDNGRQRESLNIVLSGIDENYKEDKEKLILARNLRDKKEIEYLENRTGFQLQKNKVDFITYFEELAKISHESYQLSLKYFKKFHKRDLLLFTSIDKKLCSSFAQYLQQQDIASSTASLYYKKFSATLNHAVRNEIIQSNPAKGISIKPNYQKREFLTEEEIKILINTPMQVEHTKNAFIFACFTGLRLNDLQKLKFSDIKDDYLYIEQTKTKEVLRLKLSPTAVDILEHQKEIQVNSQNVFSLKDKNQVSLIIKRWIMRSGIKKNITFHCSRHTFATLLLTNGVDIYTVSKLIGHKDLKTTQIYAKIVDQKKDDAISKLPTI